MLDLKLTTSEVLETGFVKLKDELRKGVALKLPNPDKPFVVETDASIHAVGALVLQGEGEQEYCTLFYSQPLNAAQSNCSTYERELLAVVKACDAFRVYLLGRECTLRTDHAALSAIFKLPSEFKKSRCEMATVSITLSIHCDPYIGRRECGCRQTLANSLASGYG